MPGQELDVANPPPQESRLSDELLKLAKKFNLKDEGILDDKQLEAVKKFRRLADYLAVGMLI